MARVGRLDFESWLAQRKGAAAVGEDGGEHAYAYVSDRQTRTAFARVMPVQLAVEAVVRMFKAVGKNELLGHAVRVGPRQFPRVHNLVVSCSQTLGIPTPTVYIVNSPILNAGTYGTNDDSFILVHSALVDHMSDEELLSVFGHECGHIHNSHVVYLTTLYFLTEAAGLFVRWIVTPALVALRSWSRRAEITCDRASLLCVRDLDTATRSLAKLALGSRKLYDELNLEAFLEQHEESQQGPGRYNELFATHPWLPKRVLALRVFHESRLFRSRMGLAHDGLAMREVDDKVLDIVKVVR
ncbi:MAG: M48 family metallopeptidase [Polyangiaceae bacterium]|jgi:Zn-dependent protease with chaperone function|nr:M48 family metallopeptidase [Polyangiaceae bacterium]